MKKVLFALLAASLGFAACQIEILYPNESNASDKVLSAKIEQKEATKTVLDENSNIRWSENDQIVAFTKTSYGHKYQIQPSFVGKTYANFSRISSLSGDDLSAGMEWDHNVAYYPYSEYIECVKSGDNYTLDVVLPAEQTYAENSLGNGYFPMVAVSEDNYITFKNVCGGIKLQLIGTQKIASISIQGKNNEILCGAATVTAYTDGQTKPAILMADGGLTSVTLNCGAEGIQLNENSATEFIITLPPVYFSTGFIIHATDIEDKSYVLTTDKANTIIRSSILVMPPIELEELNGEYNKDNEVIVFKDKFVENVCVSHFDLNNDGKLSKGEAAKVLNLESEFFGDFAPVVTSFTELRFFTSLKTIPSSCFEECTKLTSVTLPESITRIERRAFCLCESLTDINLIDKITYIGDSAFSTCSCLKKCYIPKSVTSIPDGCFFDCESITELTIPESINSIGSSAFMYCNGIKEIIIPNTVTSIEEGAFWGCSSAETIVLSPNVVSLKRGVFLACAAKQIVIPEGVVSAADVVFAETPELEEITIPSTMLVMGDICTYCENLKTVYCKAATPPSLSSLPFVIDVVNYSPIINSAVKIYVPKESIEAYKTADIWKEYSDNIIGIDF